MRNGIKCDSSKNTPIFMEIETKSSGISGFSVRVVVGKTHRIISIKSNDCDCEHTGLHFMALAKIGNRKFQLNITSEKDIIFLFFTEIKTNMIKLHEMRNRIVDGGSVE